MAFDLRSTVEGLVKKIQEDPSLLESFTKEPEKTVERAVGADIPDGMLSPVIDGVKAAVSGGKIADLIGGLGGLFGK